MGWHEVTLTGSIGLLALLLALLGHIFSQLLILQAGLPALLFQMLIL
jgi:hypothetical protein